MAADLPTNCRRLPVVGMFCPHTPGADASEPTVQNGTITINEV